MRGFGKIYHWDRQSQEGWAKFSHTRLLLWLPLTFLKREEE